MIAALRKLSFTYLHYQNPALKGIDLELEDGSITALVGAVGAGKTTLLLTLNGLIPELIPGHMEGQVVVYGIDTQQVEAVKMAEHTGLVFDDPQLQIVGLTVEEDVAFGPGNLGLNSEQIRERVTEALHRIRLDGYEKRNPRMLSGGEQQLLAVGGIMAMRPRLVTMDEPVSMLDPVGKAMVLRAIQEMRDRFAMAVLISESGTDIEPICEFADTVVLLHEGEIVARDRPGRVFADRELVMKLGIKPPQVTRLAWELGLVSEEGFVPTTVDEALRMLSPRLSQFPSEKTRSPSTQSPQSEEAAIVVNNLHHTYTTSHPPVEALRGIDLTVSHGEMIAILGQNGSGKTTLAYHLVGVLKPTNKDCRITVNDLDLATSRTTDIIQRINYVFQNPANQLFCQTFGDEVRYGPRQLGLPKDEIEQRAAEALKTVGLDHVEGEDTVGISRAGEALLGLASILSMAPDILIVDEPTGGLDWAAGKKVMQILTELNRKGRTIIIITHDMDLAAQYCQRIIVLKEGSVFMDGHPREVFSQPEVLKEASLYPPQITRLAQTLSSYGVPQDILRVEEFIEFIRR